ncbi:MAG: hypothetical protein AABZ60_10470, partial [Planctomycetota bacterium]
MGRWVRYSIFFLISGVIHLFLCVDFLKLKNSIPSLNVQPLVETFRNGIQSSPINTSDSQRSLKSSEDPSLLSNSSQERLLEDPAFLSKESSKPSSTQSIPSNQNSLMVDSEPKVLPSGTNSIPHELNKVESLSILDSEAKTEFPTEEKKQKI